MNPGALIFMILIFAFCLGGFAYCLWLSSKVK